MISQMCQPLVTLTVISYFKGHSEMHNKYGMLQLFYKAK